MKNNWIDEWEKALKPKPSEIITEKICEKFDERTIYSIVFSDKSVYVGISKDPWIRLASHKRKSSNIGVRERIKIIQYDFLIGATVRDSTQVGLEQETIDKYRRNGFNVLNVIKGGNIGKSHRLVFF